MTSEIRSPNSIHDPDGYIVRQGNKLLRIISSEYLPHYEFLMESELYHNLVSKEWLLPHKKLEEVVTLEPKLVPFISYPYEWSFSQLKDTALLTLNIQKMALEYGMTLKDAPASNIQFINGKPILIDITSFETYQEGKPWQAYRQFCEGFLAPLALASYVLVGTSEWLKAYPDGMPIKLATKLIPKRHFISELGLHLYLHSKFKSKALPKKSHISKKRLQNIINSLYRTIKRLPLPKDSTLWRNYYSGSSNYSKTAIKAKEQAIKEALSIAMPDKVLDLGCNEGFYTVQIAKEVNKVVAIDSDYQAIDSLYRMHNKNILPLVADICNPSPASGWLNTERDSLLTRLQAFEPSMVVALALIHHLCLKSSISLNLIADFFQGLGKWLLIEFVPEYDEQVVGMTATIDTHYPYNQNALLKAFSNYYSIEREWILVDSQRTLYLMRRLRYD